MEVFINTELERGHEGRLSDEDEVVVLGKVFEEKPEFTQSFDGHKVGVVNDGEKDFPFGVEGTSFFDETGFAFVVPPRRFRDRRLGRGGAGCCASYGGSG